ncbi:MAG: hypothetical protein AUI14_04670 [Actinobacteria bacterium 13_2_20CM_2_71_6]|nr:MAG: hypothetical protein AUI14_04670 [Actinobacteria bacterium 13_2_20CM_2_71_6]
MSELTYPEIGATRTGELPAGYHHLRHRTRLGRGTFEVAGDAVLTWRMHRAAGVAIRTSAPGAEPGVRLDVGLGVGPVRLWAPCQVVWTVDEEGTAGWGYGTLAGHPECGEEAFLVTCEADGEVWLTIIAFSRPARWFTRAAGPLVPAFQRAYAGNCGRALRRICSRVREK